MQTFKSVKEQKAAYLFGFGLLTAGAITFASMLFYAFLSADKHGSIDASLSSMDIGIFTAVASMVLGTVIRGLK